MDPITAIVTALALGAAEGLKPTATQAIKDLYSGLKHMIQQKYAVANNSLEALEKMPNSENERSSLQKELSNTNVQQDTQLLQRAQALISKIEEHSPHAAQDIGVTFEYIKAANMRLKEISVSGENSAVSVRHIELSGDFDATGIKADTVKK